MTKVRIKTLEELEEAGERVSRLAIRIGDNVFLNDMHYLCNTIHNVDMNEDGSFYIDLWTITPGMYEVIEDTPLLDSVCETIGVEVNEVWLGSDGLLYIIEKNGCIVVYHSDGEFIGKGYECWQDIFTKKLKPVWRPKKDSTYYSIDFHSKDCVRHYVWRDGDIIGKRLLERGLVFETKEEALEMADKMLGHSCLNNQG